jgi:GTPase SAR1 family protein
MLPLVFRAETAEGGAMSLRVKVFTVPGQVVHSSTRRLVLQGADGIVFVADSQLAETENNAESFLDLRANLKEMGRSLSKMPLVIQFNKRDLPNVRSDAEIDDLAQRGKEPVYKAVAMNGVGVLECFFGLLERSWHRLDAEHDLTTKLGLGPAAFLEMAASSMGHAGKAAALAGACVGGNALRNTASTGADPRRGGAPT